MSAVKTVQDFVSNKLRLPERKKQLKAKYIKFGHTVLVQYVMPNLNSFVRHLIEEKGLDPDYVPPPPTPPVVHAPPLTPEYISQKLSKFLSESNNIQANYTESWVRDSFKNPSKHPVMKARLQYESKSVNPAPLSVVIDEPLQVALGSDAATNLNNAVQAIIEKTADLSPEVVILPESEKVVKRSRRRMRSRKSNEVRSVVTKSFNGNFRRVDDK